MGGGYSVDSLSYNRSLPILPGMADSTYMQNPLSQPLFGGTTTSSSSSNTDTLDVREVDKKNNKETKTKSSSTSSSTSTDVRDVDKKNNEKKTDTGKSDTDKTGKVKDLDEAYRIVQSAYKEMQNDKNNPEITEEVKQSGLSDAQALTTAPMAFPAVAWVSDKTGFTNYVVKPTVNGVTYLPRKAGEAFTNTRFGSAVVNSRVVSGTRNAINYGTNSADALIQSTGSKYTRLRNVAKRNYVRSGGFVDGNCIREIKIIERRNGTYFRRIKIANAAESIKLAGPRTQAFVCKAAKGTKWLTRAGGPAVAIGTVIEDRDKLATAYKHGTTGQALAQTGQTAAKATGAGVGFWAGAKVGAALGTKIGCAIGSIFPGAGNAIGAAVGGVLGGLIGGLVGSYAGKKSAEALVGEDVADKIKREQIAKAQEEVKAQEAQVKSLIELAQYIEENGTKKLDPRVNEAISLINESLNKAS